MPPREKGAKACLQDWAGHFLRSALRERFAQLRPSRAISQELQAVFSAVQTAWRRERNSNPRYPFGYIGFQDRLFQPLTHPSAAIKSLSIRMAFGALKDTERSETK